MKTGGEKKERMAETAIAALLTAPTIADAAKVCGVSEVTLWRWTKEPEFAEQYREARRQALSVAIARLQQLASSAVKALSEIAEDTEAPASSRVSAAKAIIEGALRAVEVEDLEARLARLEKQLMVDSKGR